MRIADIHIAWFRGAADPVSLPLKSKSMLVYGTNGSGKSSFVDAVEYAVNNGRISHLAHEYSGKRQQKGIPNTHKPKDRDTELRITFKDEADVHFQIHENGTFDRTDSGTRTIGAWDYPRTILRQDEVSGFIHDTKGGKYSALLPLLGLHEMEVAAENLRQLAKTIERDSHLSKAKGTLEQAQLIREKSFPGHNDDQILTKIRHLHTKYCPDKPTTHDLLSACDESDAAINARIEGLTADQKRYLALHAAGDLDLESHVNDVRSAIAKLADATEPLITEKIGILDSAHLFADKLPDEGPLSCPACGQAIPVHLFRAHVEDERDRLQATIATFESRKTTIATLCDTLKSLKSHLATPEVKPWRDGLPDDALTHGLTHLDKLDAEALRASCHEGDLQTIESKLLPLVRTAAAASANASPDAKQLNADAQTIREARLILNADTLSATVVRTDTLISFVASLEQCIRSQIRLRSQAVIDEISDDIQAMWSILHPGESVEEVRLYVPQDADKAIDIGLKFHGVDQESPRLTLSEGHRNSLGLCIFLAMAKRETHDDRPLFLDDVVVSLDRNHRGMIVDVLQTHFSNRQVIILTHDRDWYTELRHQLDDRTWLFRSLLPYDTPQLGIRWSNKTTTFDDARAQLKRRPDAAGNDVRKIMDVELALIAERLQILMPYLRSDRNDKRMAHDFLQRLIATGKSCFQKKNATTFAPYTQAIDLLKKADALLLSWANRASHSFDLVRPEAAKLLQACETALDVFKCPSCGKAVWYTDARRSKSVQCHCGDIRWRYGKA